MGNELHAVTAKANWKERYRAKNIEKNRVKWHVYNALKTGAIVKKPCAECGINEHITAHHEDYTKPLDIIWLCKSCHQQLHGRRKRNV